MNCMVRCPVCSVVANKMADGDDVTEQDLLALHEDILEGSEEAVRELLEDFCEDGTPTLLLCTSEIQVRRTS